MRALIVTVGDFSHMAKNLLKFKKSCDIMSPNKKKWKIMCMSKGEY